MTDKNSGNGLNRRRYLVAAGAAGTAAIAGCGGNSGGGSGGSSSSSSGGSSGSGKTLELLHGWTSGDGGDAVQNMIEGFKKKYPDVNMNVKGIGGGGNTSLDTRINTRLGNGNPPSSFVAWPGKHLLQFTDANLLGDIGDSVWGQNSMKDAYLQGPQDAAKPAGTYVCVPTNIHRMNNLFYNKKVIDKAGVDVSSIQNPSDLADAIAQVDSKTDAVGMAQSSQAPWTTIQLWAAIFLGQSGWDAYQAFMKGNGDESKIADAFKTLNKYSKHFNSDESTVGWKEANQMIVHGKAGFFHNGDWAAGMYTGTNGFKYGTDWDQVPFPGTEGLYSLNMDSWVYPKDNPSSEVSKKWLSYVGSKDAQVRFNTKKGSIPPRKDVSMDKFGEFQTNQYSDFQNSTAQPPSVAHGLATTPQVLGALQSAINQHYAKYTDSAANATAKAFVNAFN